MKEAFDLENERGCDNCKHMMKGIEQYPCKQCKRNVGEILDKWEQRTNADRIRAMSDEELAEFLPIVSNFLCRPTDECMNTICNRGECEKTKECALDWLKSPTTD